MKKTLLSTFFLGLFSFSLTAQAALPPYYQSVRELKTLLELSELGEKFGSGREIRSIVRTEEGYLVSSQDCQLPIDIKYLPLSGGMVGPARFKFTVGELSCRD